MAILPNTQQRAYYVESLRDEAEAEFDKAYADMAAAYARYSFQEARRRTVLREFNRCQWYECCGHVSAEPQEYLCVFCMRSGLAAVQLTGSEVHTCALPQDHRGIALPWHSASMESSPKPVVSVVSIAGAATILDVQRLTYGLELERDELWRRAGEMRVREAGLRDLCWVSRTETRVLRAYRARGARMVGRSPKGWVCRRGCGATDEGQRVHHCSNQGQFEGWCFVEYDKSTGEQRVY
jgi:hypothetical protein